MRKNATATAEARNVDREDPLTAGNRLPLQPSNQYLISSEVLVDESAARCHV
jgi:hypothetical protein